MRKFTQGTSKGPPHGAAQRFGFGKNWRKFLSHLDSTRILAAEQSLQELLGRKDLTGSRFLDLGSGSGVFSLAARNLGAEVWAFDFDPDSVSCARALKDEYRPLDDSWHVEQGDVLDRRFMERLGSFDVVYSWGVLHHTGNMWKAIGLASDRVREGGLLAIAIYNDQGRRSRRWLAVKKLYNALPRALRFLVIVPAAIRLWGPTFIRDVLRGQPLALWRDRKRGMDAWRDLIDWIGGLPFEVAGPDVVFEFCRDRGFNLIAMKTCKGGHGCNEFVFRRIARGEL